MKAVDNIEQTGRKSRLASIGMCSQGANKTTEKLDKLYIDGNALVHELVARGEAVEAELKDKLSFAFKGKEMIEEKIALLKAKLGMTGHSRDVQLDRLSTKVDNLIEVVAKLAEQKAQQQAANQKVASKPARARKTAAKSTTATKATSKTAAAGGSATAAKAATKTSESKTPAKPRSRKSGTAKAANKTTDKPQ